MFSFGPVFFCFTRTITMFVETDQSVFPRKKLDIVAFKNCVRIRYFTFLKKFTEDVEIMLIYLLINGGIVLCVGKWSFDHNPQTRLMQLSRSKDFRMRQTDSGDGLPKMLE